MRIALLALLSTASLAGCSTKVSDTPPAGYETAEIANIDIGTSDQPRPMRVYLHSAEKKLLVRNVAEPNALATSANPLAQEAFEAAAQKHFAGSPSLTCVLSKPTRLSDTAYEFNYDCKAARPSRKKR